MTKKENIIGTELHITQEQKLMVEICPLFTTTVLKADSALKYNEERCKDFCRNGAIDISAPSSADRA